MFESTAVVVLTNGTRRKGLITCYTVRWLGMIRKQGDAQIYVGKQNKHLLLQLQAFRRSPAKLK